MASTYCEPGEVARAKELWARAAALCAGGFRRLAAAPLILLGAALLLDGDVQAAGGAAAQALEVKPEDKDAKALLGLVSLVELGRVVGDPTSVLDELRQMLREERGQ